jgi:hypothetical protein
VTDQDTIQADRVIKGGSHTEKEQFTFARKSTVDRVTAYWIPVANYQYYLQMSCTRQLRVRLNRFCEP